MRAVHPAQPHTALLPWVLAQSQRSWCHPMLVLDPRMLALSVGAQQERGPLSRSLISHQVVADAREAPDPPGPLTMCGAPAPSQGRPAAAQAPHAATHSQPVGLEGRLDSVSCWQPKCPGLESGGGERR